MSARIIVWRDAHTAQPRGIKGAFLTGPSDQELEAVEYVPAAELDEAERELRVFKAGLTDALRAHNVPATPTWADAIHWLARHGGS